jgi:hypothetical protein
VERLKRIVATRWSRFIAIYLASLAIFAVIATVLRRIVALLL